MSIKVKTLRLLLVDDDEDFIQYFLSEASSYNVHVDICKNVKSAVQQIQKESFDAYIIDLQLPDGSGYEIIEQIRQRSQGLIAVVSGIFHDEENFRKLKEKYSVQYILDKPIYHNQIEKFFNSLISDREESKPVPQSDRIKKLQDHYKQTICDKVDQISNLIAQVKRSPGEESLTF